MENELLHIHVDLLFPTRRVDACADESDEPGANQLRKNEAEGPSRLLALSPAQQSSLLFSLTLVVGL